MIAFEQIGDTKHHIKGGVVVTVVGKGAAMQVIAQMEQIQFPEPVTLLQGGKGVVLLEGMPVGGGTRQTVQGPKGFRPYPALEISPLLEGRQALHPCSRSLPWPESRSRRRRDPHRRLALPRSEGLAIQPDQPWRSPQPPLVAPQLTCGLLNDWSSGECCTGITTMLLHPFLRGII